MLNEKYTRYKLNYPKYVIMIKNGNFYTILDNDAIIINKILGYKVSLNNNSIKVGFPINSLNKVIMKLDSIQMNYLIIGDDIIDKTSYKSDIYDEYLNGVNEYKIYIERINEINKKLINNINNENIKNIINDIEDILCKISS